LINIVEFRRVGLTNKDVDEGADGLTLRFRYKIFDAVKQSSDIVASANAIRSVIAVVSTAVLKYMASRFHI